MKLVEKHIVKDNRFEDICLKSGLLYNYVLYNVRQGIFNEEYLKEYEFSTKLCKENQFDFRNLPSAINGAIGIGRKVFGDSYVNRIIDSGLAFNPIRVNIL